MYPYLQHFVKEFTAANNGKAFYAGLDDLGEMIFDDYENNKKIKASDVLAEWDPFTLPIVAQTDGHIILKDLEEGVTTRQIVDDSTGLTSNIVIDWKQQAKNQHLVPRVEIHDKKSNGKVC